ncbi:tryptophan-rich sensory protein [Dermacoccaceae bacterium W4C1]
MPAVRRRRALVTGATGYVGGLLVPRLLDADFTVRVLTRHASGLDDRDWARRVDIVEGDAGEREDLEAALRSVDVAYYLLHSMDGQDFAARDREMARDFGAAASRAGVGRIVYLSGLHPDGELSEHLASRVEVGEVLMDSGVPTAVLQAAVVLGDGSASFDMLRYLTTRLPVMVTPSWLDNRIQPIAVDDALDALVAAADLPATQNRTYDIGGPEVLTYRQMIQRFAAVTGLRKRLIRTVPVLSPGLAAHWVGAIMPVDPGVAVPLVGSLVHEVVCAEDDLGEIRGVPRAQLTGYDEAVRAAMQDVQPDRGRTYALAHTAAVVATAVVGSAATDPNSRWYRSLDQPSWQPPRLAFPVVWTLLYADLAAVTAGAAAEFDRREQPEQRRALQAALGVNLVLNAGWSWTFFRGHRPVAATAVAAALTLSSADLVRRVQPTGRRRGLRLAPYPIWCAFATALSAEIARRN